MNIQLFVPSLILMFILSTCQIKDQDETSVHEEYTCPMHPQIQEDKPGTCPICNMDLVKKNSHNEGIKLGADLNFLLKPSNAAVVGLIKTVNPIREDKELSIELNGIINYDPKKFFTVPIRYGGRIEKLFIKYNYQKVDKGQKLMEIYSPDLITAQKELLYLLKSDPNNEVLLNSSKQKLRLLGVSESQINIVISSGEAQYSFSVYSPNSGYIVESGINNEPDIVPSESGSAEESGNEMGGMGGAGFSGKAESNINTQNQPELSIREGMYLNANQTVFKLIGTTSLRAEFNLNPRNAARIKTGDILKVIIEEDTLNSEIDLIQPFYDKGEQTIKIRVNVKSNSKNIIVGQFVKGLLKYDIKNTLWIPKLSVYDLGTRQVAFVKENGGFQPKQIISGTISGDMIEVKEGLKITDHVAFNAQFMVDSESFIKVDLKNQ